MITPQAASTSQALVDALLDARRVELEPRNGDEAYLYALAAQHQRIHTAQIYASIRPTQLKRSVEFLETKARSRLRDVIHGSPPASRPELRPRRLGLSLYQGGYGAHDGVVGTHGLAR